MLQKIEVCFKECVRRNKLKPNNLEKNRYNGGKGTFEVNASPHGMHVESPSSAICSANSDTWEPSQSFKIDSGTNETQKETFLKRYEDLQTWIWKESFSSSTLCAMAFGKKRCLPVVGICDGCLGTYDAEKDRCPSCNLKHSKIGDQGNLSEGFSHENDVTYSTNSVLANSSPPRIRLLKALLALLEVSVPIEALHSSWTEDCRNAWGLKLQNSSSMEDILQILNQFERAIQRDYLSADFETTEELLSYCASSKGAAHGFVYADSVLELPWLPKTTSAVALRLLELDASIFYSPNQKAENHGESKLEDLPKLSLRYAYTKDVHKAETMEFDRYGSIREENWDVPRNTPGSSGYKQVARGRGGRPRGKSQKGSKLHSSKRSTKQVETLSHILLQQGSQGQKHGRGRRTVRKRRTEKKVASETLQDYIDEKVTFKNEKPINTGREEFVSSRNMVVENDDSSNNIEADDSDNENENDNTNENSYQYEKWGSATYNAIPDRSNEMMEVSEEEGEEEGDDIENENVYEEEDDENLEGDEDMGINEDDSFRDRLGNGDESSSESLASGEDYSD